MIRQQIFGFMKALFHKREILGLKLIWVRTSINELALNVKEWEIMGLKANFQ